MIQNVANALTGATINDQAIASDLLAAGKLGAISLTLATLEAATPELRSFFQESLNECLADHGRVSALAIERGWYKAYATPAEQLAMELKVSEPIAQAAREGRQ